MSSSSGIQIAVALFRRDPISTDPRKRRIYQHESYHWGVLAIQGEIYDAYDATDRNRIDPITFRQENPAGLWWLNARENVEPERSGLFLGCIIIGAAPSNKSRADIKALLEKIPMPQKNQNPQESCVTWVANAIRSFHEEQYIDSFDVWKLLDWALSYADDRLKRKQGLAGTVHYEQH